MREVVMRLDLEAAPLAICRLGPDEAIPGWASMDVGPIRSVTRTADELSIVVAQDLVPDGVEGEGGWRALSVCGPLDFALTGVLASLAAPLADAAVPIFVVSTFDTDWLLLPGDRLEEGIAALEAAGHEVAGRGGSDPDPGPGGRRPRRAR